VASGRSEAPDLTVTQPVVDQREEFAGRSHPSFVAAPSFRNPPVVVFDGVVAVVLEMASIAAHRTNGGPCLVIDPRCTVVSDSRCRGVSPAQDVTCFADPNLVTSPNSAQKIAARTGPPYLPDSARVVRQISALGGARSALAPENSPSLEVRLTVSGPRGGPRSCASFAGEVVPRPTCWKGAG
jgi:hypothetical protein